MSYLILLENAMHNFLGDLGIPSACFIDPRAGITAWLAAAAHEGPNG